MRRALLLTLVLLAGCGVPITIATNDGREPCARHKDTALERYGNPTSVNRHASGLYVVETWWWSTSRAVTFTRDGRTCRVSISTWN